MLLIDIDECAEGAENNCDSNAICTNIPGSHTCQCIAGYTGPGHWCEGMYPFYRILLNIADNHCQKLKKVKCIIVYQSNIYNNFTLQSKSYNTSSIIRGCGRDSMILGVK